MVTWARLSLAAAFALLAPFSGACAAAQEPGLDYSRPEAWLCRPDKPDACQPEAAVILSADGKMRPERRPDRRDPSIDCFYLYPTVSEDPGSSATGVESEAERRAVRRQAARLRSVCRLYAPLYRQATASRMRRSMEGDKAPPGSFARAQAMAEADVIDAWRSYLARDNRGRGVVLIGHSQGANLLQGLIKAQIEAKPAQRLLVSAVLPGSFVVAPRGQDVGGTFTSIPACRKVGQIGCVIVFNAYRASSPPPTPPRFEGGVEPLCTNPAALAGGSGVLKPYRSTRGETIIPFLTQPLPPLTEPATPIAASVVSEPDLFRAQCRNDAGGVYLSIEAIRAPDDRRTGALVGDWTFRGERDPAMGLHLIDLDLTQGNLIDIIAAQAVAYSRPSPR